MLRTGMWCGLPDGKGQTEEQMYAAGQRGKGRCVK